MTMGIMARDIVLCVLIVLQLLGPGLCYHGDHIAGGELPRRALLDADDTHVLRSSLLHRDSLQTGSKTSSERFLEAVKRSQIHVQQLQKRLIDLQSKVPANLHSAVSSGDGDYVMQFSVGTPAKKFSTIVDTGSDLIWIQCLRCTHCLRQPHPFFNPRNSESYTLASCGDRLCGAFDQSGCTSGNTCTYTYSYGDGSSTRGDLAYETITLDAVVPHIGFGCGHNQAGTFSGADGKVGLGQGPLSLPSQLSRVGVAKIFSYCFVSFDTSGTVSSPITFGRAAQNSAAKYTPLITNTQFPAFYYVGVTGITVGSEDLNIPASAFKIQSSGGGGTIMDSGTSITTWLPTIFNPILEAFRRQITYPEVDGTPYGLSLCYDVSSVTTPDFPPMVVHLTQVDWNIPVSNLFESVDNSGDTVCLAMADSDPDSLSIIGNYQQQNNLIVYDSVNKQIGFRQVRDCGRFT